MKCWQMSAGDALCKTDQNYDRICVAITNIDISKGFKKLIIILWNLENRLFDSDKLA